MLSEPTGYSSGGFIADVEVDQGKIIPGTQQQFFARNVRAEEWGGTAFNSVLIGTNFTKNAPQDACGSPKPTTLIEDTPIVAEKPYIVVKEDDQKYQLAVPPVRTNTRGTSSSSSLSPSSIEYVDFEHIAVITPANADGARLHDLLCGDNPARGIVFTPGIYHLGQSIVICNSGQILLGLGYATLIPLGDFPAVFVKNHLSNVRVASLLFQAGVSPKLSPHTSALLQWGNMTDTHDDPSTRGNPFNLMHDIFVRVGGTHDSSADPYHEESAGVMCEIWHNNVIGDNLWLWRADHGVNGKIYNMENPVNHGLVVHGHNVTMYGLAVEHTLNDLTLWYGRGGRTYFYQAELPYDVDQEKWGQSVGYRIVQSTGQDKLQDHKAYGVGVYAFFRDHHVVAVSGIYTANFTSFVHPFTWNIEGKGVIQNVLSSPHNITAGSPVKPGKTAYYCGEEERRLAPSVTPNWGSKWPRNLHDEKIIASLPDEKKTHGNLRGNW